MMYITQGLKRAEQINGRGIATIDGQRQRTWGEFAQRVAKLAGVFRQLGLSPGGRVAILSLNSDRYLETFFAVPWADGIIVPLNVRLAPRELSFMLKDSGAELLLVDETFKSLLPDLVGDLNTVKQLIYAGDQTPPSGAINYETALAAAEAIPDAERGGNAVAGIFYTGGTTGIAKGVMLTHDNLVGNAMNTLIAVGRNHKMICLHAAPMFHIADASANCSVTMLGDTHAFIPKFEPKALLDAIQTYKATNCPLVPTMLNLLLNHPDAEHYDLSSLKLLTYGGSPMPQTLVEQLRTRIPHCKLLQAYGMTELAGPTTILDNEYHTFTGALAGKIKSVGQSFYNNEIKIIAPDDTELPRGVVGEIIARGPNVMQGYWNQPEETTRALRHGWLHTGDAGYIDEDGFLFLVDRYKDMIKSGGENVFSIEVENAIYQYPAVSMCAVIGIPDEKWGEVVHAIVVPKPDQQVTAQAIIQHCRELIAGYKCPRSVEFRQEALPLSGAGKIMKAKLREPYWQGHERRIA